MAEVVRGIYNQRRPESTSYYRVIESFFEDFARDYPDTLEQKYGWLKQVIINMIYAFLDCGIPEHGVARIRCKDCGSDYFVAFSCHKRNVCPSCTTKRSLLFSEKVVGMTKPVKHLHMTFTIPKLLRPYFRRDRKLLKLIPQSANFAVSEYFRIAHDLEDGMGGGIYYIQTYGTYFNFHPHVHAIVPAGLETDGVFHEAESVENAVIAELFRNRLLKVMADQGVLTEERREMLLLWNHNSGFNVHSEGRIDGSDDKRIETVALYLSRPPVSVQRVDFDEGKGLVHIYRKPKGETSLNESVSLSVEEFLSLLVSHIPEPYEPLVYYYGIYSSSHRGKEKRLESETGGMPPEEVVEEKGTPALQENGKMTTSSWARLIRKVFEVDPLICIKCGGEMKIIAFITEKAEIKRILRHLNLDTPRPPPLTKAESVMVTEEAFTVDYIPTTEDYLCDPVYPD